MEAAIALQYSYSSPARDITCGMDVTSGLPGVLDGGIAAATLKDRSLAANANPIHNAEPIMQVQSATW